MPFDTLQNLNGFEFSHITLLAGVIVAASMQRINGVNPGGLIAAAFLILAGVNSIYWAICLLAMGAVVAIVYQKFFSHIFLGRRPGFIMAGMSVVSMTLISLVLRQYNLIDATDFSYPLGLILPAILALSIRKQGVGKTYGHLFLATAITIDLIAAIYLVGAALGHDFHALDALAEHRASLHIGWGTAFSIISVALGYCLYVWKGVKSAGYIMLPFLATLCVASPLNFLLVIALAVIAYAITALLSHMSLIIGINRYALVAIISIALAWTAEYTLLHTTDSFSPFMGTTVFAALAITAIVNEHTIYSVRHALPMLALSIAVMVVVETGASSLVQLATHHQPSRILKAYVVESH